MDKILTIIISASVIMMVAVSMMFMASDELGGIGETASENRANCDFQVQQYCDGSVQITEIDQSCLDQAQTQCATEEQVNQEIAQRADIPVAE